MEQASKQAAVAAAGGVTGSERGRGAQAINTSVWGYGYSCSSEVVRSEREGDRVKLATVARAPRGNVAQSLRTPSYRRARSHTHTRTQPHSLLFSFIPI